MTSIKDALDHLLIGAPTLESGIAWLEEKTGVRAVRGGSHPGLGTWNALASLGPARYIEIIAPDPAQPGVETFYVPGLRDFKEARIATWAARGRNLGAGFGDTLPANLSCGSILPGSRVRPDGTRLNWTLAFPKDRDQGNFGGALPFLIEWDSLAHHPGRSAPAGLTLVALAMEHPESERLGSALNALGIDASLRRGPSLSIRAEVEVSGGTVVVL